MRGNARAASSKADHYQAFLEVSEPIAVHHDLPAMFRDLALRLPHVAPVGFTGLVLHTPYLKQFVERLGGEHARHTKLRLTRRVRSPGGGEVLATCIARSRSGESAIVVEAFMNNAGLG